MSRLIIFAAFLAISASLASADESLRECPTSPALPHYPQIAAAARVEGVVQLRVAVDETGKATATVLSGHPMLADAAKRTVEQWAFPYPHLWELGAKKGKSRSFEMRFVFRLNAPDVKPDYGNCSDAKVIIDFPNVEVWSITPIAMPTQSQRK